MTVSPHLLVLSQNSDPKVVTPELALPDFLYCELERADLISMKQYPSAPVIESLETRSLFAATLLDSSFASGGVATIRLRGTTNKDEIGAGRVAGASDGSTYVLARAKQTYQLFRLTPAGQLDTTFAADKRNILVFPDSKGGSTAAKLAVDASDRVLLIAGSKVIRLDKIGHLDTTFGGGAVALTDFAGITDFSIDGADRVYVTGLTTAGNGVLVERLISRGRLDRTFSGDGRAIIPIPASITAEGKATTQGVAIRALNDGTPTNFTDDTVLVTGSISVNPGSRDGAEAARLTAAGDLDTTYGTNGVVTKLGGAVTDYSYETARASAILPTGGVDIYDNVQRDVGADLSYFRVDHSGVIQDVDETVAFSSYTPNPFGGYAAANAYGTKEYDSSDTVLGPARGALASLAPAYIDADDRAYVSINNGKGRLNVARFLPSALPSTA